MQYAQKIINKKEKIVQIAQISQKWDIVILHKNLLNPFLFLCNLHKGQNTQFCPIIFVHYAQRFNQVKY